MLAIAIAAAPFKVRLLAGSGRMKTADVIVVGGGIAGISVAARLAPDARVVVLERESSTCYHATGRSAAVFIRNYGNKVLRVLNGLSQNHLLDGGYLSQRGELLVALPDQGAHLDDVLSKADTVERVDEPTLRQLVPILREGLFIGGAYEREAYDIDVDLLVQSFARQLRQHGGEVITDAEVVGLTRSGETWNVETRVGDFEAPVVVNAAGAWADMVATRAGLRPVNLQPLRRSAAIVPIEDHDLRQWPLFAGIAENWYGKPEAGQLMVSPADEDLVAPQDAYPDDLVLAEGIHRFEQSTTVSVRRVTHRWAGLRTFATDRTPVMGFDPRSSGFFWLAGQGGYGIQTAPALSLLAADLVLGRVRAVDSELLAALSPARFSQ